MTSTTTGLCQCGCGERTEIAKVTRTNRGWVRGQPKRYIASHAGRAGATGEQHHRWKGGRYVTADGYVMVYVPMHPRASSGYVLEHLLVAERALGKPLPRRAQVHHVDENRSHNSGDNLVICESLGYHKLLHKRQRALDACGDPSALRCVYCHGYDRQDNITATTGGRAYHRTCANLSTKAVAQ